METTKSFEKQKRILKILSIIFGIVYLAVYLVLNHQKLFQGIADGIRDFL